MLPHGLMFNGKVSVAASSLIMSKGRLNPIRYLKDKSEYMLCYIHFIDNGYTLQSSDSCVIKIIVLTVFTEPV